jgi:2-hydroxy-3-keto-5-methylthiopentenyl-1-phosphate phosphatase
VGDGLSDRCGANAADEVFARGSLWDWCEQEGVAARRFERFADLRGMLSAM